MNWLGRISSIIGYFWHDLFLDSALVKAFKYCETLTGAMLGAFRDNRLSRRFAAEPYPAAQENQPVRMLLKVSTMARNSTLSLSDSTSLGVGTGTANSWTVEMLEAYPSADYMTNALFDPSKTLLKGSDYSISGTSVVFSVDPATLGFCTVTKIDSSGTAYICYVAYGWNFAAKVAKDAICSIYGTGLEDVSDIVWAMHVNGATKLSVLQLLAWASDAVVCAKSGQVEAIWQEGPSTSVINCITIAGKTYCSRKAKKTLPSDNYVPAGYVLFGDMAVYDGKTTISSTDIPSMTVMTDAGEVTLPNSSRSSTALMDGSTLLGYALGVTGDNSTAYAAVCKSMFKDQYCPTPVTAVAATQNPLQYVAGTLRRGRGLFIRLGSPVASRLTAAVNVIKRAALALGSINIYTTAVTSTTSVSVNAAASLE